MTAAGSAMTRSMTAKNRHALSPVRQSPEAIHAHTPTQVMQPRVNSASRSQGGMYGDA